MTDRTFKPGDRVCYRPSHDPGDYCLWEFGKVVRQGANNMYFVIYDQDRHPKATYARDLWPEFSND